MARYPYSFTSKDVLQPGARGGTFVNNGIPGHRTDDPRINRTNNHLEMNDHDVLNIKYGVDPRLPALFRYGWAYGYNQFIITKGRIVAVDPDLMVMDTDTMHFHNALTLANGGVDVKLVDREWVEATEEDLQINPQTGELVSPSNPEAVFRKANKPIGIIERNEYTRDSDAFNGMIPGPVRTDALIELPWFLLQEKAEGNPWGSCYGEIKPGMLVKSDLNGRVCISPLSDPELVEAMSMAEYEKERQQVIGEVYSTDKSLLPEGAAKYAQWALDDRLNFEDINPFVWPNQNRTGEDFVNNTPTMYQSDFTYPGYPYDRTMISNDLHMLASSRVGSYDPRFDEKHRLDRGIPGLTDGGNVITRAFGSTNGEHDLLLEGKPHLTISHVNKLNKAEDGIEIMMKLPDVDLVDAKVAIGDVEAVNIVAGAVVNGFEIKYVDLHKGLFSIKQLEDGEKQELAVKVAYVKKGMAGVPTNLDWDGCVGVVRILLQK